MSTALRVRSGGLWQALAGTVPTSAPPRAPRQVRAVAGDGTATVTWTAPVGNGGSALTAYRVEGGPTVALVDPSTPTVILTGLTNGQAYDLAVRAVNAAGIGTASRPVRVTPSGAVPEYGPSGELAPPDCPPYNTVATHTAATLAALTTKLGLCTGGEVIEYTGALTVSGSGSFTIPDLPNLVGLTTKVLIRAPLGSRLRANSPVTILAQNVVLAGVDVAVSLRIGTTLPSKSAAAAAADSTTQSGEGNGSWSWRCASLNKGTFFATTGASDAGHCELVRAQSNINSGTDVFDAFGYARRLDGHTLLGVYFGRNVRTFDTRAAYPILGVLEFVGSVAAAQSRSITNATGVPYTVTSITGLFGVRPGGGPVVVNIDVNGVTVRTVSTAATAFGDLLKIEMGSGKPTAAIVLQPGDTLTATVVSVGSVQPGGDLRITVGKTSAAHTDTVQYAAQQGGSVTGDLVIAHSVVPSSSNAALQPVGGEAGTDQHHRLEHNWSGFGDPHSSALLNPGGNTNNRIVDWINNYVAGSIKLYPGHTYTGNRARAFTQGIAQGTLTADETNIADPALPDTLPPLADLTVIWADCPFSGNPFGDNP